MDHLEKQLTPSFDHSKNANALAGNAEQICLTGDDDGRADSRLDAFQVAAKEETDVAKCGTESKNKKEFKIDLPNYPQHGVIGKDKPLPINLFYKPKNVEPNAKDFRIRKFDFHEMYEKQGFQNGTIKNATPLPGLGYLHRGFRTEDFYKIDPNLPLRFRNPDLLEGYGCERNNHPLFRTTSSEYGNCPPTIHDVPHEYHGLKNTFTSHLSSTGMPKNRSLNIK